MAYPTTNSGLQDRVLSVFRRDPRKSTVLIVLGVLFVFMLVRTLGGKGSAPRSAAGSVTSVNQANSTESGKSAKSSRARAGDSDHGIARPTSLNPALQKWAEQAAAPISRNLFSVRLEYFPTDGSKTRGGEDSREDQGFWGRLEKSLSLQADQKDKRENQIAHYKARAAELRLQSTMMGPQPKAMVNGELVGEGDVVAQFRVLKIEARRIIVEREGIRLEILMK